MDSVLMTLNPLCSFVGPQFRAVKELLGRSCSPAEQIDASLRSRPTKRLQPFEA
jgi:hypothetical protein